MRARPVEPLATRRRKAVREQRSGVAVAGTRSQRGSRSDRKRAGGLRDTVLPLCTNRQGQWEVESVSETQYNLLYTDMCTRSVSQALSTTSNQDVIV